MKSELYKIVPGLILLALLSSSGNSQSINNSKGKKKDQVSLFNGKNLEGWVFMLKDNSADPAKVFTVKDGVIHITGSPFGYMRTGSSYSDYSLHVEWRWPSEASNSGIFIHAQLPDTIWPRCFECQLAAGNAGDFICANGSDMNERADKSKKSVKKMNPSNERSVGQWNVADIVCRNNTIEVRINGLLQNKATGTSASGGYICLQSEGKDVEFRNLVLTRLR
jgi:hypothetical protein